MKSILLHVQDDPGMEARLQAALAVARANGGHISCVHVTPISLYFASDGVTGAFLMPNFAQHLDEIEQKMRRQIEARLEMEDVPWDYEQVTGEPAQVIVSKSALSDLIILGRGNHRDSHYAPISLIGDVLQTVSVPILVQPHDHAPFDPLGPAMVAWNGSFEAANALRAALPMLRLSTSVHIVTVAEPKEHELPSLEASSYLSRHGVKSELHPVTTSDTPVAHAIQSSADVIGACYIVMGGYGHGRAREFLFGGVTRSFLTNSPFPLLMAH